MNTNLQNKEVRAYALLTALVICGLASSVITAPKVVEFGINFPFSNIVFSIFTYPIVDAICELWGKRAARQAMMTPVIYFIVIVVNKYLKSNTLAFRESEQIYN